MCGSAHRGLGPPTSIIQSRKCTTCLPAVQSGVGGIFSLEVPFPCLLLPPSTLCQTDIKPGRIYTHCLRPLDPKLLVNSKGSGKNLTSKYFPFHVMGKGQIAWWGESLVTYILAQTIGKVNIPSGSCAQSDRPVITAGYLVFIPSFLLRHTVQL